MTALALHCDDLVDYIKRRFHGRDFLRDLMHDVCVCVQMLEKPPPRADCCAAGNWLTFPTRAIEQSEFQARIRPSRLTPSHKEVSRSCQNAFIHPLKKSYSNAGS